MTFEDEMKEFWASLENLEDLVNEEQPKQKKRRTRKKKSKGFDLEYLNG